MNGHLPSEEDKELRKALHAWRVDVTLPPRFQEGVWKRIESAQADPSTSGATLSRAWNWLATTLTRPVIASAYMAMLLLIGAGVGHLKAQAKMTRIKADLQARYVQMVDPYRTPR